MAIESISHERGKSAMFGRVADRLLSFRVVRESLASLPLVRRRRPAKTAFATATIAKDASTQAPQAVELRYIPELDGLRCFACMAVLVGHLNAYEPMLGKTVRTIQGYSPANIGVILFFCLSGYLIATMLFRDMLKNGKVCYWTFLSRRAFRIWPLYYFYLAIAVLLFSPALEIQSVTTFIHSDQRWREILAALGYYFTFLGNWTVQPTTGAFAILWTVSVEEQFYCAAPLIFFIACKGPRVFLLAVALAVCAGYVYRLSYIALPHTDLNLYYLTPTYLDAFALGALGAARAIGMFKVHGHAHELMKSKSLLFVTVLLLLALGQAGRFAWGPPYSFQTALVYGLISAGVAIIVNWTVLNSGSNSTAWLRFWAFRELGVLSYGIYIFHVLAKGLVELRFEKTSTPIDDSLAVFVVYLEQFSLSVVLSSLSFAMIERPMIMLRERLLANSANETTRWSVCWARPFAIGFCGLLLGESLYWLIVR